MRIILTGVALIALTGCTSTSAADQRQDQRTGFITSVRTTAPANSGVIALTDDVLWSTGDAACATLRKDVRYTPAMLASALDRQWPGAGATIVAAALSYVCPEFADRVSD
jgi:hypothetical protein